MNELHNIDIVNKENFINTYNQICRKKYGEYIPSIMKKVNKLFVFGDLHGDLKLLKKMLKLAQVVDDDYNWIGNNAYIVQVGDQIDRCRPLWNMDCSNQLTTVGDEGSDIEILKLCNKLHEQAQKVGGAIISLLGNHELMNVNGNLTYVSYEGRQEFNNYIDPENPDLKFKSGEDARKHAFKPGNEIGTLLGCSRYPAVIIGTHLFVHAGIVNELIEQLTLNDKTDIETINIAIRMWLLEKLDKKFIKDIIDGSNISMFWTRLLGGIPPNVPFQDVRCVNQIGKVLKLFKVNSIIIGHTPQSFVYSESLNHTCDGKVWRVDNGSSKAFARFDNEYMNTGHATRNRRVQILEIYNDKEYFIIDDIGRKQTDINT